MKEKYNMDDSLWCDLLYAKIHEREGFLFSQEGGDLSSGGDCKKLNIFSNEGQFTKWAGGIRRNSS
jgi:hypothetical protein